MATRLIKPYVSVVTSGVVWLLVVAAVAIVSVVGAVVTVSVVGAVVVVLVDVVVLPKPGSGGARGVLVTSIEPVIGFRPIDTTWVGVIIAKTSGFPVPPGIVCVRIWPDCVVVSVVVVDVAPVVVVCEVPPVVVLTEVAPVVSEVVPPLVKSLEIKPNCESIVEEEVPVPVPGKEASKVAEIVPPAASMDPFVLPI